MKSKIFIASFSVIFAIAMQQTKQHNANAEQTSRSVIEANPIPAGGGGITTDDPMSGDSLFPSSLIYSINQTTQKKKGVFSTFAGSFAKSSLVTTPDPDNACDITPANCINNMAGYTFTLDRIQKRGPTSYAKNTNGDDPIPDYHDVKYKEDILSPEFDDFYSTEDELKGCAAQNNFCETDSTALNYLTYYPDNINYDECKLPCILLFHAGGYSDCSNYNYEDSLCYVLARKGFVVFLVEYRRGRIKDDMTDFTSAQQLLALYRAFQDGRGAIRSIIKRQRNAGSSLPYQIDTNKIFVAGQSAGGTIANSLAYYRNQAMINSAFPVATGDKSIEEVLGPIDADYYNGTPDIEYQSKIIGLWSMWTGFSIPIDTSIAGTEYNFLSNNGTWNLVPMIGMMGKKDDVFPIHKQDQFIFYPPQLGVHYKYTTESYCINQYTFNVYDNALDPKKMYRIECTNDIYTILKDHGIPTLQYLDCKMHHGLIKMDPCPTDFGAPGVMLTLNQVNEYLAARACFFFQSIMSGTAADLKGASKFTNCLDFRHSDGSGDCAIKSDHDTCEDGCPGNE